MKCSEVISSGQSSAARQVGSEKQTKRDSGTARRAGLPPNRGQGDLTFDPSGPLAYDFALR